MLRWIRHIGNLMTLQLITSQDAGYRSIVCFSISWFGQCRCRKSKPAPMSFGIAFAEQPCSFGKLYTKGYSANGQCDHLALLPSDLNAIRKKEEQQKDCSKQFERLQS
jgi:hypothetical protein